MAEDEILSVLLLVLLGLNLVKWFVLGGVLRRQGKFNDNEQRWMEEQNRMNKYLTGELESLWRAKSAAGEWMRDAQAHMEHQVRLNAHFLDKVGVPDWPVEPPHWDRDNDAGGEEA